MKVVEVAIERRDTHERIELSDELAGAATELFHRLPGIVADGRGHGEVSETGGGVETRGDVLRELLSGIGEAHVPGRPRAVPEHDLVERIDPNGTYLVEVSEF